jgi:hypothetical protein
MKKVFAMGFVAAVMGLVMGCVAQQGDGSEGEPEVTGEAASALRNGAACLCNAAHIAAGVIINGNTCQGINEFGHVATCECDDHDCFVFAVNPPPPPPPPRGGTPITPPVGP